MIIKSRALNKNETFCCSKNDIKKIFGASEILANFAYYGGRHFEKDKRFYKGIMPKGQMIAELSFSNVTHQVDDYTVLPWTINFYVLKKEEYPQELHEKFVSDILPKLFEKFQKHESERYKQEIGSILIIVNFFEKDFSIRECNY